MNDPQTNHPNPPSPEAGGIRRPHIWTIAGAVSVGAAAFLALLFYPQRPARIEENAPQFTVEPAGLDERLSLDENLEEEQTWPANPGYVGMQVCARCHAERVAEFEATRHFLACCEPDPETMPSAFSGNDASFAPRELPLRFEMTRSGNDFFETAIVKTASGEQRTTSRIDLVYGAGAGTDEVYLSWKGDLLYELPIAWLEPEKAWGASAFVRQRSGDSSRELTQKCLECHNTWFEHAPGTLNRYRRETAVLGVSCEKCHGPGREHAAFHQGRPDATVGAAIVRPARLSRERQIDLCAQCHSNAITYRGPAFSYVPGEPLEAYFRTVHAKHPEDDHVANQVSYLRESKCFQSSDTLTCTTCHNPHRPRNSGPAAAQSACLQCHQAADCDARKRLPAPVQDNCVGCHMPVSSKVQVYFETKDEEFLPPVNRWEHRIGIYPTAEQQVLLEWRRAQDDAHSRAEADRLTSALDEHWIAEGDRCRQQHRYLPAIYAYRQAFELNPAQTTQAKLTEAVNSKRALDERWAEALRLVGENRLADAALKLEEVLRIEPENAKAHGKLGAVYAAMGRKDLAVEHLEASAKLDPDEPYGPGMLGWIAYLEGRFEESLEHYRRVEEIEPYNAKTNYQIGLALSQLDRSSAAEQRFRQALRIDPNHAGACQALSHALRQQGQAEEALRYALRAARLTKFQNVDVLVTLADSYANVDRLKQAGETATEALAASQARSGQLAPEIRLRLELLRDRAKRSAKQEE